MDVKCLNCGAVVGQYENTTLDGQAGRMTRIPNYRSRTMTVRYAGGITGPIDIHLCADCYDLPSLDLDKLARAVEAAWLGEASTQAVIDAAKKDFPITLEERT